jgi:hypothetical protein
LKNAENKKTKFEINQTSAATKKLIKEPKDALFNALAHADQTDKKDNHGFKNHPYLHHQQLKQKPQNKTRMTQLLHAAILMAFSSLTLSFYQNNKH